MINALALEFYKTRRRKVWLFVAALIAVQLAWMLWSCTYMDDSDLQQGWMLLLYQFPLLNAIMMPVIIAALASRLCDIEHKGQTFKLVETMMPAGRLYTAKFLCGAVYIAAVVAVQLVLITAVGTVKGFAGEPPLEYFGYYFLFTLLTNLTILILQMALSLLVRNQMIALAAGLIGGLTGLFSMYLPQQFGKFILWGYYGVLMIVGMDWDRATRIIDLYWRPVDWPGFIALLAMFLVIYTIGRMLFVRKEI